MITCTFENGNVASPGIRHITVGTILLKNDQVLLCLRGTKNGKPMLESGKWGLLGGFMDRDETLIECAKREIYEESGYEVKDIYLFRINDDPGRPMEDRQNVDFIFVATAGVQKGTFDEEVRELKWFDLSALPQKSQIAFDHDDSLQLYIEHLSSPKVLPILG